MKTPTSVSRVQSGPAACAPQGAYQKPTLNRLGTFRELTQQDDLFGFFGWFFRPRTRDCMMSGSSTYTCHRGGR
ncbi:MAG: hypothetical protein JWL97_1322 [Gemmatimonadales bacterium]|nr:hypothetical protein [Gemmatimonadales bacterium]